MNVEPFCQVEVQLLIHRLESLVWPVGERPGEYAMLDVMPPQVTPVVRQVLKHLSGRKQGITFLSRLVPNQFIEMHTDHHDNDCQMRVHVPLMTNELAIFSTEGKNYHFQVGYAYVIDPTREHGAYNGGDTDRIHLMFNAVG